MNLPLAALPPQLLDAPVRPRSRYRSSYGPTQLELFRRISVTGGLDDYSIVHQGEEVVVHLPSVAAKLGLPEERLRSTMLSMPGCHISGSTCNSLHQLTTQLSGQSVRLPLAAWAQGLHESQMSVSALSLPTVATRMRKQRSDAQYQRDLVKHLHEVHEERVIEKQRRMDAREMIAKAPRIRHGPTMCFGFAGGVTGPAFQLQSEQNATFDPEDCESLGEHA